MSLRTSIASEDATQKELKVVRHEPRAVEDLLKDATRKELKAFPEFLFKLFFLLRGNSERIERSRKA